MNDLNIYTIESLLAKVRQGMRLKYLFFWGHQPRHDGQIGKQCLSQWWPSAFEIDTIAYPTAEHYMMAEKARLFEDYAICERILSAPHPGAAKSLGREVKGFREQIWAEHRFEIVVRGNEAKFGQNEALRTFLLNTKKRVLAEASPVDRIWGIGVAEDNRKATQPEEWRGLNLLGFALMKVRTRLSK